MLFSFFIRLCRFVSVFVRYQQNLYIQFCCSYCKLHCHQHIRDKYSYITACQSLEYIELSSA